MQQVYQAADFVVFRDRDHTYWWRKRWYARPVGAYIGPYAHQRNAEVEAREIAPEITVALMQPRGDDNAQY